MSTPDPAIYPSAYYVELSLTEHGPALVASSPNLVIRVPEPIDGQIAGWVVQVPPVAGGWEIAEGAVAAHLYAISRGEPGDPNVTQVHPTAEPGAVTVYRRVGPHGVNGFAEHTHDGRPHGHDGGASPHRHPLFPGDDRDRASVEPARVVDGLTVGARYNVRSPHSGPIEAEFGGKGLGYYGFRYGDGYPPIDVHENDLASGAAVIIDLDGNRVDYWAEQARAFIAYGRTYGMTDDDFRTRPIWTRPGMKDSPEPAALHALPRVLDEQESTR